ncbi:hypothetical protein RFM99_03475 [Mesorhizobium sp. VK4C]|uniref:hypothetical protein n=1 Tax=Mesorhizobium captivum TaxID=3072319 RepID=UPI002A24EA7D|nr:hypothetical protein [Mesorhizobium sp. VK4C]MDX8497469.1 hypothetical protein [Mesorhizobium sp. VK4C]
MFFCQTARLVALLVLVLSLLQLVMGFVYATSDPDQIQAAIQRTGNTPGKLIDRGLYGFLVAIALGALSEIGVALKALANKPRD